MLRFLGITAGVLVQALFVVTSYYTFLFLLGSPPGGPDETAHGAGARAALAWDALLALQFGIVHSLLLRPNVKKKLARFIAPAFYGLFFCTVTCLTLLLAMSEWQVGGWAIWQVTGAARLVVQGLYVTCWGTLFYSLWCSGFGFHTGWLPWWYWVKRRPIPSRPFKPRGSFSLVRHPGYLSFLGLIWFTPEMTIDRALLVAIWTVYIFIGSHLKDLRLIHYLGDTYRDYQARVPAFVPSGRRRETESPEPLAAR